MRGRVTHARGTKGLAAVLMREYIRDSEHTRSVWERPALWDREGDQGGSWVDPKNVRMLVSLNTSVWTHLASGLRG